MNHNCEETRASFSDRYDGTGDIPASECESCEREYAQYKQIMDEIRALPEPDIPLHFRTRVMQAVNKKRLMGRRIRASWATLAAACFVMAVLFWVGLFDSLPLADALPLTVSLPQIEEIHEPQLPGIRLHSNNIAPAAEIMNIEAAIEPIDSLIPAETSKPFRTLAPWLLLTAALGAALAAIKTKRK